VREFWETSQNPIVHTLSGVWENLTGDTDEGITIAEIRKKDPKFVKEEWTEEVRKTLVPTVLKAHLTGDTEALRPWLSEGVFNKLAADIRMRKEDGISFDTNILEIDENQAILKFLEDGGPVIVMVYMVQQINCVRKKGEIIEVSAFVLHYVHVCPSICLSMCLPTCLTPNHLITTNQV
jgi:import inner membrane translocase subunit TIM44